MLSRGTPCMISQSPIVANNCSGLRYRERIRSRSRWWMITVAPLRSFTCPASP